MLHYSGTVAGVLFAMTLLCFQHKKQAGMRTQRCARSARGVDAATARKVLVYSFGAEVTGEFAYPELRARIQGAVDRTLANVPILEEPAAEAA